MKVRVEMKNGDLYAGIKGGAEGGLLYLFNPERLEKDHSGRNPEDIEWSQALGGEDAVLMLPIVDIKLVLSQ